MTITDLIKREYHTTDQYSGVNSIKGELIYHKAIVVQNEDAVPLGVLTPMDIVKKPHNLVIDCLSPKAALSLNCSVNEALTIMEKEQASVLPVYEEGYLQGLVFKNDLVNSVTTQNFNLEKKIEEGVLELNQINTSLESSRKVLKAIFDSTESLIFLISSDYTLLFFNKKAYENSISQHGIELQLGERVLSYMGNEDSIYGYIKEEEFEKSVEGEYLGLEKEISNKDEKYWFKIEYIPVYDIVNMIGVCVKVTNVHEKKRMELELEIQNKLLREIAWTESHLTRQPVATILGLILVLDKSDLNDDNKKIIDFLEQETKKLDNIIRKTIEKANSFDKNVNWNIVSPVNKLLNDKSRN